MKLNPYRIMWNFVFFDLPTATADDRRIYAQFRKNLLKDGYHMLQFSVYVRHCISPEQAATHRQRLRRMLPEKGNVCMLRITDKQFGEIEIFQGRKQAEPPPIGQQLELFV